MVRDLVRTDDARCAYSARRVTEGNVMADIRRILLDGYPTVMVRDGDELVARDGRSIGVDEAVHLSPVEPTKIICCHLNHVSRVVEFGVSLPPAPTYFHKPVSALNAHGAAVVRPSNCKWLNFEGEVAIVIGRTCRNVSHAEAGDYIAGYTVANDYGLHDFRDTDSGSMLRVKGADTLCPLGPGLITGWDFHGKRIRTLANGEVKQHRTTAGPHSLYGHPLTESLFMRPGQYLTRWLVWFDNRTVDGVVRGVASGIGGFSEKLKLWETGYARSYALTMVGGVLALGVIFAVQRWW